MAKYNKPVSRIAPELDVIIKRVMAKNLMKGKSVKTPRITLAMARQYKKYPNLLKELEESELK